MKRVCICNTWIYFFYLVASINAQKPQKTKGCGTQYAVSFFAVPKQTDFTQPPQTHKLRLLIAGNQASAKSPKTPVTVKYSMQDKSAARRQVIQKDLTVTSFEILEEELPEYLLFGNESVVERKAVLVESPYEISVVATLETKRGIGLTKLMGAEFMGRQYYIVQPDGRFPSSYHALIVSTVYGVTSCFLTFPKSFLGTALYEGKHFYGGDTIYVELQYLDSFQLYMYLEDDSEEPVDWSGAYVTSNATIAGFAEPEGHIAFEQIPAVPVGPWGTFMIVSTVGEASDTPQKVKFISYKDGEYWIDQQADAQALEAGETVTHSLGKRTLVINSTVPLLVLLYGYSKETEDPFVSVVSPFSTSAHHYTVMTPTKSFGRAFKSFGFISVWDKNMTGLRLDGRKITTASVLGQTRLSRTLTYTTLKVEFNSGIITKTSHETAGTFSLTGFSFIPKIASYSFLPQFNTSDYCTLEGEVKAVVIPTAKFPPVVPNSILDHLSTYGYGEENVIALLASSNYTIPEIFHLAIETLGMTGEDIAALIQVVENLFQRESVAGVDDVLRVMSYQNTKELVVNLTAEFHQLYQETGSRELNETALEVLNETARFIPTISNLTKLLRYQEPDGVVLFWESLKNDTEVNLMPFLKLSSLESDFDINSFLALSQGFNASLSTLIEILINLNTPENLNLNLNFIHQVTVNHSISFEQLLTAYKSCYYYNPLNMGQFISIYQMAQTLDTWELVDFSNTNYKLKFDDFKKVAKDIAILNNFNHDCCHNMTLLLELFTLRPQLDVEELMDIMIRNGTLEELKRMLSLNPTLTLRIVGKTMRSGATFEEVYQDYGYGKKTTKLIKVTLSSAPNTTEEVEIKGRRPGVNYYIRELDTALLLGILAVITCVLFPALVGVYFLLRRFFKSKMWAKIMREIWPRQELCPYCKTYDCDFIKQRSLELERKEKTICVPVVVIRQLILKISRSRKVFPPQGPDPSVPEHREITDVPVAKQPKKAEPVPKDVNMIMEMRRNRVGPQLFERHNRITLG